MPVFPPTVQSSDVPGLVSQSSAQVEQSQSDDHAFFSDEYTSAQQRADDTLSDDESVDITQKTIEGRENTAELERETQLDLSHYGQELSSKFIQDSGHESDPEMGGWQSHVQQQDARVHNANNSVLEDVTQLQLVESDKLIDSDQDIRLNSKDTVTTVGEQPVLTEQVSVFDISVDDELNAGAAIPAAIESIESEVTKMESTEIGITEAVTQYDGMSMQVAAEKTASQHVSSQVLLSGDSARSVRASGVALPEDQQVLDPIEQQQRRGDTGQPQLAVDLAIARQSEQGLEGVQTRQASATYVTSHMTAPNGHANLNQTQGMQQLSIAQPVYEDGWGHKFIETVRWMVNANHQRAEIKLDPPDLGPLKLDISLKQDHAQVMMVTHSSQVREVLDQHLPRLREMLASQGFESVDAQAQDQQKQSQRQPQEQGVVQQLSGESLEPIAVDMEQNMTSSVAKASKGRVDCYI